MIDDYVFLEVLLIELEWLPPSDYSRWECGLVKSLIYKQRIGIRGETLFRSVDRSGSISFLSLLENRELMRVWERSNFPILFENYETICEPSLIITLYDRKNWFLLNNCNDNEWMKCKTRYKKKKKKKESSRTISYNLENGWRKIIKISIQFHYEREIFRAISETYSIPKKPFQLSERAYFIGNTLEKFHQDLRFRKTFTKLSPCEEDFFHNRANKILLQSLSLSLQISTDLFLPISATI